VSSTRKGRCMAPHRPFLGGFSKFPAACPDLLGAVYRVDLSQERMADYVRYHLHSWCLDNELTRDRLQALERQGMNSAGSGLVWLVDAERMDNGTYALFAWVEVVSGLLSFALLSSKPGVEGFRVNRYGGLSPVPRFYWAEDASVVLSRVNGKQVSGERHGLPVELTKCLHRLGLRVIDRVRSSADACDRRGKRTRRGTSAGASRRKWMTHK